MKENTEDNIKKGSMLKLQKYVGEGSNLTPAHHYPDFRFKTYAPLAFRYFRELFGIKPDDYLDPPKVSGFLKQVLATLSIGSLNLAWLEHWS
ncbi:UNVERIFIED_CONTAM: hypothetical protein K2H54_045571 [Gekko kuhli]